jgi:hypothetical protein
MLLLPLDLDHELLLAAGFLAVLGFLAPNALDLFRQLFSKLLQDHLGLLEFGVDVIAAAICSGKEFLGDCRCGNPRYF